MGVEALELGKTEGFWREMLYMKTLKWQNFFDEQRESSGKVVFSVGELAEAARTTLHVVNTELGRLVRRGVITRYAHGVYGANRGVVPEDLVPAVDDEAYVTAAYALFRRGMVGEAPGEVICFTNRRHNRGDRETPAGRLRFRCVPPSIYAKTPKQVVASGEQALCDFAWLNVGEGKDPWLLVTLCQLDSLNPERLEKVLQRYPWRVRAAVRSIITRPVESLPAPKKVIREEDRPGVRRVLPRVVEQEERREEVTPIIPEVKPNIPQEKEPEVVTEVDERRRDSSWAVWD
jgi:hypothetical protein